jgi:hypothetical protein
LHARRSRARWTRRGRTGTTSRSGRRIAIESSCRLRAEVLAERKAKAENTGLRSRPRRRAWGTPTAHVVSRILPTHSRPPGHPWPGFVVPQARRGGRTKFFRDLLTEYLAPLPRRLCSSSFGPDPVRSRGGFEAKSAARRPCRPLGERGAAEAAPTSAAGSDAARPITGVGAEARNG